MSVSVWADTNKAVIDNLGVGKMCVSNIANKKTAYQDMEYFDPSTKESITYQARVYTGTMRLSSAFWGNSVNTVNCSIWF